MLAHIKHNTIDRCAKIGTDKDYQAWVRKQPSLFGGESVYCHVRRANNSGTGMKPEYSGVPMSQYHHEIQHQKGEKALLEQEFGRPFTTQEAKDFFDNKAEYYRRKWIEEKKK